MEKKASVTVDPKTGQLRGWDSIFSHLNAVDRARAEAEIGVIKPVNVAVKKQIWKISPTQPFAN
jgi:hypothetical protein